MTLDEKIALKIKETAKNLLDEGKLPTLTQLDKYYQLFRLNFGPEKLGNLEGLELLETIHGFGVQNLVYWLEFKNDEEFPTSIFGSISGGSALKYGIYKSVKDGEWKIGTPKNIKNLTLDEAIGIARKHRNQLIEGVKLVEQLLDNIEAISYFNLQSKLRDFAPDVENTIWGHKYFSLICHEKIDSFHMPYFQTYYLLKLLQLPQEGTGRYLNSGFLVSVARELNIPMQHLYQTLIEYYGAYFGHIRTLIPVTSGQHFGIIRTA